MLKLLKCKEAVEMCSRLCDGSLTRWEKISLKIHCMMCKKCRIYSQKMTLTVKTMKSWLNQDEKMPENMEDQLVKSFKQNDVDKQCCAGESKESTSGEKSHR